MTLRSKKQWLQRCIERANDKLMSEPNDSRTTERYGTDNWTPWVAEETKAQLFSLT